MGRQKRMEYPLLEYDGAVKSEKGGSWGARFFWLLAAFIAITSLIAVGLILRENSLDHWSLWGKSTYHQRTKHNDADVINSEKGVVAADDRRCSKIGASMLQRGGHAVDAAVAAALCLGVVNPTSSGIGGGAFMIVWSSSTSKAQAFNMREAAPSAASQDMYENNPQAKSSGALSVGIPGELAGLYKAWLKHGRLAWRTLFQPAIKLAKDGFALSPYVGKRVANFEETIMRDRGLRKVYAPNGRLLKTGETCYNVELGQTLEMIAEQGPQAFYNGTAGEKLISDIRDAGGILTMEDLRNYNIRVTDALAINVMGHTIMGMPPPSSGTLGLSLVLNILDSYGNSNDVEGNLGAHRFIEALKHMFALRVNLGDPYFVDNGQCEADMLSPSFAKQLQQKIFDNATFPPGYYLNRWSQLPDHGSSHVCIVDAERNAVSITTSVNFPLGAKILSPSTGVLFNNEMNDFSTPTELSPDELPPSPANFIEPNKQPLSSMTPLIIIKDGQLAGVIGASGGIHIIPTVAQVFLNHFVMKREPLAAVLIPRIYHTLVPNVVWYENWTLIDGDHVEVSEERQLFLKERGHELEECAGFAMCQLVVQTLQEPVNMGRKHGKMFQSFHGILTAVSDPRKGGKPAGI